jgi:predicted Zn-ribbon and HTH transcriptional regulator
LRLKTYKLRKCEIVEKLLTVSFTPQQMDYVFQVLAMRPYSEVVGVIQEIQSQVKRQQTELVEPVAVAKETP